MVKEIIIANYINGEFIESEKTKKVKSPDGSLELIVSLPNRWEINAGIEAASFAQAHLNNIPIEKIQDVIKKTMGFYLQSDEEINDLVNLTGSSKKFLEESTEGIKNWCLNIDSYVKAVFGDNEVSLKNTAPVGIILPNNSPPFVPYLLSQTLISKNSSVIRTNSYGTNSLLLVKFIESFNKAIDSMNDESLDVLRYAINTFQTDNRDYLEQISLPGWNYIVSGNNESVENMKKTIQPFEPRNIVSFGSGFSSFICIDSYNIKDILDSATSNAGKECECLKVLYVHSGIYEKLMEELKKEIPNYKSTDPFNKSSIGKILPKNVDGILSCLHDIGRKDSLNYTEESNDSISIHATGMEMHNREPTTEYPGPIFAIRKYSTTTELSEIIDKDLDYNNLTKNLATSIYYESEEKFQEVLPAIKSHTIKKNKPTHHVNLMKPHQGFYLLEELVEKTYLD